MIDIKGKIPKTVRMLPAATKDPVSEAYAAILETVGRPFQCVIEVEKLELEGGFSSLSVEENRNSVPFLYDNGNYGYRKMTHVLSGESGTFGLVCQQDGKVELFILEQDDGNARLIGKKKINTAITDPMFAFTSSKSVYIVFNLPTYSAIASGVRARKPKFFPDGSLFIASGRPVAVRFDMEGEEDVEVCLPKMSALPKYVTGLVSDPMGGMPLLLVANVFGPDDVRKTEERPSFRKLVKSIVSDDVRLSSKEQAEFPAGISVAAFGADTEFVPVPMDGSVSVGVKSVRIEQSQIDGMSTVSIIGPSATEAVEPTRTADKETAKGKGRDWHEERRDQDNV